MAFSSFKGSFSALTNGFWRENTLQESQLPLTMMNDQRWSERKFLPWLESNLGPSHHEAGVYPSAPFRHGRNCPNSDNQRIGFNKASQSTIIVIRRTGAWLLLFILIPMPTYIVPRTLAALGEILADLNSQELKNQALKWLICILRMLWI